MKKVITFSVLFLCSIFGYSDNNLNQQTGMYYITANNFFYRPSTERGNEVVDRQNASEFSDRISGSAINITDSLVLMLIQAQLV